MAGFLDSSIDMYKQQMQAVESMADGEEQLKSEGLMSSDDDKGIIADYTQRFVNYLRAKREEDRQAMLAERAAETAEAKKPLEITLEDVEQFQKEVDARKSVPEDEPFKYHVDHYTMQDIDTGVDSEVEQLVRQRDVEEITKDAPSGIMSKPVADEVQPPDGKVYDSPDEMSDLEILARTIEAEAAKESYKGKIAVGAVIVNRAASGRFGEGIKGVILEKGQFSPWNSWTGYAKGEQGQDMMKLKPSRESYKAAKSILGGDYEDPTNGATHYLNPEVGTPPSWLPSMKNQKRGTIKIENHLFGNADNNKTYDGRTWITETYL